jgi:hypothetical protein
MRRIAVAVLTGTMLFAGSVGASEASAACKRPQGAFWPTEPNWIFPISKGSGLVLPMRKLEVWSAGGRLNYPGVMNRAATRMDFFRPGGGGRYLVRWKFNPPTLTSRTGKKICGWGWS